MDREAQSGREGEGTKRERERERVSPSSLSLLKKSRFVTVALSSVAVRDSKGPIGDHVPRPLAAASELRACDREIMGRVVFNVKEGERGGEEKDGGSSWSWMDGKRARNHVVTGWRRRKGEGGHVGVIECIPPR